MEYYNEMRLRIRGYKTKDFKQTVADYDFLECVGEDKTDVVLVSASSAKELKKAYPNYFGDIKQFINKIENLMYMYN